MSAHDAEAKTRLNSKLLAPSFPRKKGVSDVYRPNSYRVLFEDAEFVRPRSPLPLAEFGDHLSRAYTQPQANRAPRPRRDLRHHNPQPWTASFLRENVSTMLAPVCHVSTHDAQAEQDCWWVNDPGAVRHSRAPFSLDSTSRAAFQPHDGGGRAPSLRPKFTEAANGIVPANPLWEKSGHARAWRERVSYEHQYDSRNPDNYPVRGRRHGAFALDRLSDEVAAGLVDPSLLQRRQQQQQQEQQQQAAPSPHQQRSSLPFRAPNSVPYHRQFVRPRRQQPEESVANLLQPEFRFAWNAPRPAPRFTE